MFVSRRLNNMIVGIDEVGRGPWAGPLVMGAVVLGDTDIKGLTDSKKLSPMARKRLSDEILLKASAVGLGWVHSSEIDEHGLSKSLELACRRALEQITVPYHEIIIDGTVNFLKDTGKGRFVTTMKKADLLIASVSAASIVAKVARDEWMAAKDELYPGYGFSSHVGYGTAAHKAALTKLGLTPLHRRSFAPIAKLVGASPASFIAGTKKLTSKQLGDAGESVAAQYLMEKNFTIIARNWKTLRCEIDIVAKRDDIIYCVEVKHRKENVRGGGVEAITAKKLDQMRFAANMYVNRYGIKGDVRLAVITTTSSPPEFESMIELE